MNEVHALQDLTNAGCSSTPTLYAWKEEKQNPGGFIAYITHGEASGNPSA